MQRAAILTCLLACNTALQADVIDLGIFPAKIVPEQAAVLNLPERGEVTDRADASQRLKKGDIIAIVNRDRTAEEREDMEIALERERLNNRDEIRKLEAERKKVSFYLNLSENERKYAQDMAAEFTTPPSHDVLKDIDDRISLLKRDLRSLERRKKAEFDRSHDPLVLRMPFPGRLQYNVTLPEDPDVPYEHTGSNVQSFATVCDDSAFYITVAISGTDLSSLNEHAFSARVNLPEGRTLDGTFAFRRVENSPSGGDLLVYYFRLPEADHEQAFRMLGSHARASLFFDAGTQTERVTKAQLSQHPEAEHCESWRQLVEKVYPNHVIVLITEREIVLRRK